MLKKIAKYILRKYKERNYKKGRLARLQERDEYIKNKCIPWSKGYHAFKEEFITKSINNEEFLKEIKNKASLKNHGFRLDERVIEYPWIFSKLNSSKEKILDAGSTFNFSFVVNHPLIENKDLTIFTFAPESNNFCKKKISYVYGDLRVLPFKNEWFDIVVSQSTIEHIDMDNSIYGYDISHNVNEEKRSFEFLLAVKEMLRVLKPNGNLLLTFPYGKFENHGFFQQFDETMLDELLNCFLDKGSYDIEFFKYESEGWRFAKKNELSDVKSYNPHTGKGKGDDFAAHCRSIACISFLKK